MVTTFDIQPLLGNLNTLKEQISQYHEEVSIDDLETKSSEAKSSEAHLKNQSSEEMRKIIREEMQRANDQWWNDFEDFVFGFIVGLLIMTITLIEYRKAKLRVQQSSVVAKPVDFNVQRAFQESVLNNLQGENSQ